VTSLGRAFACSAFVAVAGTGVARATPECAREGQALWPATDDFSPKVVERMARRLLGPAFARVVRTVPWEATYRGDWGKNQSEYFIQRFEQRSSLPELRFAVAAQPPLRIEVEIRIEPGALPCVPIDLPGYHPSLEMSPTDGAVTIRAPMVVVVSMSIGGVLERWDLPSEEASVVWQREDGTSQAWLDAAGLRFGLPGPGRSKQATMVTMETLRSSRELASWKDLLVRGLSERGRHRTRAISMLGDLDFVEIPGDPWLRLRQLQDAGDLRTSEVDRLRWLARRAGPAAHGEATTFTSEASTPPPRLFVAGQEFSGWTRVGELNEIRVPLKGLLPVRAEFASRDSGQAFATVFGRGVRIHLMEAWGPTLQRPPRGPRCGLVQDKRSARCGHHDEPAPTSKMFDLATVCGGMPAASGSAIEFGLPLVPSLPGLYVRERKRRLRFDPTYGIESGAPASCGEP
jgi:hypothetical protein